jgi:ribosomal protein S12 methylthiotransferase accessory factor
MSKEMIVTFPGGKRVAAAYAGFEIMTDQSVKNGGQASAPEPYDLFLASLCTCAGIYVLSFCDKRGIPHDEVRLVQRWERDAKGKIVTITLDIELPPSFPDKYRSALIRSATQCSVKKTIDDPPEFVVQTVAV